VRERVTEAFKAAKAQYDNDHSHHSPVSKKEQA